MVLARIYVTGTCAKVTESKRLTSGLAGGKIMVDYDDHIWAGLSKTVVFRGISEKDALTGGPTVEIPWEVVEKPCKHLWVGFYGTDSDKNMIIPTVYADLGPVLPGADPSGDESTDPSLPVWAQLQNQIDDLKGNESPGGNGSGENGGYYTPSVKQPDSDTLQFNFAPSKANMPAIKPVEVELPAGPKGDDYVLTPADKAEIAEIAADLVEIPDSGGNVDYVGVEPAEDDIPKVFLTGAKPTTKDDVLAEMQYISKTDKFHAYLEIKCQGTSSMSYAKKNFTVKLYSDEARETKLKKDFKEWNHPSNKFVLKANYIDHAHARNIVSARLWGEVVASRPDYDTLPEEMRNSPNNGAVDGFPIKVYYNGNYEGVYTWNIGKDDWMWGMDEDNANHVLLCAEGNTDGVYAETTSNFRKLWDGVDGSKPGWSVEVGTNSAALKTSLNNLIQFVMDNDGDAFRNGIGNYLDIQSAIDYYIFQYEICGLDGLAHNMLLATYDGVKWICGAYDLDATFGLWWNGQKFVSATYACPEDYQERYSLLWERIEANFLPELKVRQAELRKTVLSYSNIVTHFERFMDIIGLDLYAEDLTIYAGIPSGSTNNIKQIRDYIRDRQVYVDAEFANMTLPVPCTGITLDASVLTFDVEGSQTLTATVTPVECTDTIAWSSDNTAVATVENGVVTAVSDGSCIISATCGNYSATCSVSVSGINIYVGSSVRSITVPLGAAGECIASESGLVVSIETGRYSAEYYDVEGEDVLSVIPDGSATAGSMAFYDSEKNYISGKSGVNTYITVPSGAKYARFSVFGENIANTVTVKIAKCGTYNIPVTWSDSPTGKINSDGSIVESGADAYLSGKGIIPAGAVSVSCANAGTGAYTWKVLAVYDANDTMIVRNGGTSGTQATIVEIPYGRVASYARATAYPNKVSTNNNPSEQLIIHAVGADF